MKKFFRKIVFSNSKLTTSYQYEDVFQVLPIYSLQHPQCPYAKHFPLFLEYTIDFENNEPNNLIKLTEARINKEKRILNILSCLTNHRFFNYNSSMMGWGVELPNKIIDSLNEEEKEIIENQESRFFLGGFLYHGLKDDLQINAFTNFTPQAICKDNQLNEYYTNNPIDDYTQEVQFPVTLHPALYSYYSLSDKTRKNWTHAYISHVMA